MRGLEDTERVRSRLVPASEHESLEVRAFSGGPRQLAEQVAEGSQWHWLDRLKSNNPLAADVASTFERLVEQARLAAARMPGKDRGRRAVFSPGSATKSHQRLELTPSADERGAHRSGSLLRACLRRCPRGATPSMSRRAMRRFEHFKADAEIDAGPLSRPPYASRRDPSQRGTQAGYRRSACSSGRPPGTRTDMCCSTVMCSWVGGCRPWPRSIGLIARRSSSVVEQGTHKPLVGGSNPPSATNHAIPRPSGLRRVVSIPSRSAPRRHPCIATPSVGMMRAGHPSGGLVADPTLYSPHGRRSVVARLTPEAPS